MLLDLVLGHQKKREKQTKTKRVGPSKIMSCDNMFLENDSKLFTLAVQEWERGWSLAGLLHLRIGGGSSKRARGENGATFGGEMGRNSKKSRIPSKSQGEWKVGEPGGCETDVLRKIITVR